MLSFVSCALCCTEPDLVPPSEVCQKLALGTCLQGGWRGNKSRTQLRVCDLFVYLKQPIAFCYLCKVQLRLHVVPYKSFPLLRKSV